jgi:hypothetical protein
MRRTNASRLQNPLSKEALLTLRFILVVAVALLGQAPPVASGQALPVAGSISGVVVNASRDLVPVAGAEVILRVKLEGEFVIAAEGVADEQGRFVFDDIPADADYFYMPGANLDGIHYPGPRISLSAQTPHARVKLVVHETVADPSPLVLRRHNITLYPETNALKVTETLLIENPSAQTYVGRPSREGGRAATLRLAIPSDFRRTTFQEEFYGRQFTLIDGQLVTDIPWTPGQRELAFTYVLPNAERHRVWQRPLDLPCDHLQIQVYTDTPDEVLCNLSRAASQTIGSVTFESTGQALAAGHLIHLQLGRLPISLSTYARWIALAVLGGLIAMSVIGTHYRRQKRPQIRVPERSNAPKRAA